MHKLLEGIRSDIRKYHKGLLISPRIALSDAPGAPSVLWWEAPEARKRVILARNLRALRAERDAVKSLIKEPS